MPQHKLFGNTIQYSLLTTPLKGFCSDNIYNSGGSQIDIAQIYKCFLQIKSSVGFW